MDPQATSIKTRNSILTFTLSNINVSFANALRRIIISEIPIADVLAEYPS